MTVDSNVATKPAVANLRRLHPQTRIVLDRMLAAPKMRDKVTIWLKAEADRLVDHSDYPYLSPALRRRLERRCDRRLPRDPRRAWAEQRHRDYVDLARTTRQQPHAPVSVATVRRRMARTRTVRSVAARTAKRPPPPDPEPARQALVAPRRRGR
jgi:hypothetical protein